MTPPQILTTVSRILATADLERSVEFYRRTLGFERVAGSGGRADLRNGPARLELITADRAPDSTGEDRPRGAAMVYLEVADLDALHRTLEAMGAAPGNIERVSWIKMRMFPLRDPDGHTLWLARTYAEPVPEPHPERQLRQALPAFPVSDVAGAIAHYQAALGFRINYAQHDLGVMDRDDITLLLIQRTAQHTGIGSCTIYIRNADALHRELAGRGARLLDAPVSHPWGLRVFHAEDPEGNRIAFAETFE